MKRSTVTIYICPETYEISNHQATFSLEHYDNDYTFWGSTVLLYNSVRNVKVVLV